MNKQEIRELKLTLLTEGDKIFNFIENMDPKKFVILHQDSFKNHYLKRPPIENVGLEFMEEYYMWDTISEKYREFFNSMGVHGTFKWLNGVDHLDDSKDVVYDFKGIKFYMGLIELEDDEANDYHDLFDELYDDPWSGFGHDWFIYDIVELYYDYMNDEHLEMECLVD